jgi:IS5 family transposase
MSKPRDDRQKDLLLPALDQIIDLGHPLVRLAALIDWNSLDERFSSVCRAGSGPPGLATRLVAGLFILKHMHNLSDEVLCARWIENPYYQYFCGELSFCHRLPFDRSSMTRWRHRLGEEQLVAQIQESLAVAHTCVAGVARTDRPRSHGRFRQSFQCPPPLSLPFSLVQ